MNITYMHIIFMVQREVKNEDQTCLPWSTRVDLHTPKMLIIQLHTSIVWKNGCHTVFKQFQKKLKKILTSFCGCLILIKQSCDKKPRFSFFEKNTYHTSPIYGNCMTGIFLMTTQIFFQLTLKICPISCVFSTANRISQSNKNFPKKRNSACKIEFFVCIA